MEGATTPVKALPIKAMSPDPGGRQTIPSNSASPGPDVLTRPSPLMSPKLGLSNFSKAAHMEKTIKEMRQHISKLKGEVDAEKTKNKQLYRDKISEIKQVKDNCAKEQEHALLNLTSKLEHHEQQELQRLRESLHKEHDQEIRLILREHEDQFKDQKVQFSEEKNEAVKVALELQKKALLEQRERGTSPSFARPASGNSALIVKLQREIIALKDGKKELEDNYKLKCVSYNEQAEEIRRLKKNHENEVKKLLKDTKLEAAKEQQQLKKAEDALQVMSDEVKKLKDAQTSGDKIRSRSSSGSRQSRSSSNASGDHNASHISCRSNISALELSETQSSPSIDITPNSSAAVIQDYSIINKTTEGKTDNDREQALEKYIEGNQSGSEILPDGDDDCSVGGSFGPGSDERVVEGQQDSTVESDQQHQRQFSEDRDREKERQLQKKVTELNTQVTRLDKRINLLKQENDTLKKKTEEQKPSEEKIKKLKKRNAELAAIARRLEEKAKQLQQENSLKRQRSVTSPSSQDVEQVKRAFAKQRAKDLADYAKKTMDKDQEIEGLRQRCQDLSDRLNASHLHEDAQNSEFYSEREELENLIKQAARDRLRLEKQITKTRQSGADSESSVSDERLQQLLTDNAALQAELERLQAVAQKTNKLELELSQRTVECEALYKQIDEARHKSIALEEELRDIVEKNTHLTVQNSDLRARLHSLEKLSEENSDLKTSLASAERECRESQSQSDSLQKQIVSLESQLQPMKDIEERRLQLEAEQRTTLERLKQKQQEIDRLTQDKNNAAQEHQDMVADLKAKLRELERKHQLQVIEHEEIMLEMDELRKEAEIAKLRPSVNTIEIQTEKTKSTTPSPQMVANGLDNSMQTQGYPPVDRRKEEDEEISTLEESGNEEEFRQIEKELEDLEDDLRESDTDEEQIDGNIDSINGSLQMEEGDMEEGLNFDEEEEEFETPDEDDYEQERTKEVLVEGSEDLGAKLSNKMNELETEHDYEPGLSLAKKMPFLVYIAKYRYDPVQYSPNENPEAELTLEQGDYVFVYGEMDEDGFFEGETMDGRRGLVPSNFVEKVPDEELEDFHVSMGLASQDAKAVNSSSLQQDLDFNSSDESEKLTSLPDGQRPGERDLTPLDLHVAEVHPRPRSLTPKQLSTITFKELDKPSQGVPYPLNLKLERQLSNSILMSWSPPEGIVVSDIQAYHLYVDGQFKMANKATERNKALVEGVDGRRSHRVCLRTVTSKGQSRDAQCTLVVGKDASDQPTDLSVSNLTDVSAVVAWLPGNSNLDHEISIENKVRQTLSAGVYRCFLSGLAPAYQHKVTLQVKRAGAVHDTPDAATISILTLKGGTPDAPVDVQIESGPQEGSLLVTWLPVTITTAGTSNSAEVTGYALYVDGEKIKEIPSPTGDHVILEYGDLTSIGQNQGVLTVRTQSTERESADSHPVPLTTQLMKEIRQTMPKQAMPVGADNSGESSSELSDIAEVDEEEEIGTPRAHHRGRHHGLRPGGGRHHQEPPSAVSPSSPTPLEHHHYSPRGSPPRAISPTTRMSPGRLVEGGPDHHGREVVGFRPIQKGGSQSPSMMGPIPGSHMKVPHIEITKDSSGSFSASGPENFSDDELNGHSSTSAISSQQPSPIVDNRYYDDRSGRPYRPEGQQGPPTRPPPTYSTSHGANTTDSYYQEGDDIMRQQEQEYNDRNVAKMNKMNQEQSARVSSSKNHDLDSTRPSSGRHEHHRPTSGKNKRPTSGKRDIRGQEPGVQDKKRDYFDGEGSRTPQYDEDSSYSQLEDNEARTSKVIRDDIPLSDLIDYEDDGGESLIESVDMEYDDNQVRIFIALFDYDPAVMSPNPDAMEEELPFKEGQLIKIYGDKDPDGFFLGESQGRRGFVPCNMVSEVEVNDPDIAAQLLKESGRSLSRASKSTTSRGTTPRGTNSRPTSRSFSGASPRRSSALGQGRESSPKGSLPPLPPDGPIKKMVALYDYDPQHLSPNVDSELELAFKAGDNLVVYGEMDEDGFFYGEHSGRRGLVPSNFLEEIPRTPSRNGDVLRGQHKPSRTPQSRRDGTEREPDLDRSHDRDLNRRRDRDLNRSHDRDLNRERIPRDRDSRDSRERESRDRDPRDRDPRERDRDPNREKDQVRDIHRSRERDMNRIHERDMNRSHERDLDRSRDLDHSRDSSYSKGNGVMSNRMNPSSQGAQVNSSDQVRGDKNVSFVPPTKPQRPTSPPQPNTQPVGSSVKFNPNITDSSSPAAVTRPPPPRKDPPPPAIESPPPDPHNILNLDDIGTNNKEKKKAGFFSKGIFKKFGK